MGGSINMAFRFADGEAICFEGWTNSVVSLSNLSILDSDHIVRNYAKQYQEIYADDKNALYGKAKPLSTSGYGLILIDYISKTIIDANDYTTLFGDFHSFEIRKENRRYHLLKEALERGMTVTETVISLGEDNQRIINRLDGAESMTAIEQWAAIEKSPLSKTMTIYGIDLNPWNYIIVPLASRSKSKALSLAKEINFPFNKKEGLNMSA